MEDSLVCKTLENFGGGLLNDFDHFHTCHLIKLTIFNHICIYKASVQHRSCSFVSFLKSDTFYSEGKWRNQRFFPEVALFMKSLNSSPTDDWLCVCWYGRSCLRSNELSKAGACRRCLLVCFSPTLPTLEVAIFSSMHPQVFLGKKRDLLTFQQKLP